MTRISHKFVAMACQSEIILTSEGQPANDQQTKLAVAEVLRIEHKYSRYRPDSIIGQINRLAGSGEWFACDDETLALLGLADALYRQSKGLFDITSGVLRQAWHFDQARLPAPEQLEKLSTLIGWEKVERSGNLLRLPQVGMEIDFGGFGKEYAVDRAAMVLSEAGVQHGLVNLGGDVRAIGPQADGQPWIAGIQDPRNPSKLMASIPLTQGALATSGDYERYFELDGKRYCHILNPKTAYPVSHWRSISVVGQNAFQAGCYSTIGMLMEAAAIDFLKQSGLPYLAVDGQGQIFRN